MCIATFFFTQVYDHTLFLTWCQRTSTKFHYPNWFKGCNFRLNRLINIHHFGWQFHLDNCLLQSFHICPFISSHVKIEVFVFPSNINTYWIKSYPFKIFFLNLIWFHEFLDVNDTQIFKYFNTWRLKFMLLNI